MADPLIGTTALVDLIAQDTQLPRTRVQAVLDALANRASIHLAAGCRVRLPGIGILSTYQTQARTGTGPNGQPYSVPPKTRAKFTPSAGLLCQDDTDGQ